MVTQNPNSALKIRNSRYILILVLILILVPFDAYTQCGYPKYPDNCNPSIISKATNTWYFGRGAGLDFNASPPAVLSLPQINVLEGGATLSDTAGQLLFSVNFPLVGSVVAMDLVDAFGEEIPGSNDLAGHYSAAQNAVIVPSPANENAYYVFTLGVPLPAPYGKGLQYSIVKTGPVDTIISKNNNILFPLAEKITATKHQNNKDYWIMVHEWNSNRFLAYLLNSGGLQEAVVSEVGAVHVQDNFNNNAIGSMKFSPDGCKLALAIYGLNKIELFDFDKSTGEVYNPISSDPQFEGVYGIEFSNDSKILYASTNDYSYGFGFDSKLYQFDTEDGVDMFASPVTIASHSEIDYLGLQLASDGKIYVAMCKRSLLPTDGYNYIGIIHNPTRKVDCNFNRLNNQVNGGLNLNGGKSRIGLPNFVQSYLDNPKFSYRYNCLRDLTQFQLLNASNVDSVRWDFGDGHFATGFEPEHTFSMSGSYYVKATDYFNAKAYTDSVRVDIYPYPVFEINAGLDTMILLPESFVELDARPGYQQYEWNTGESSRKVLAYSEGIYSVEVTNEHCCQNMDSIYVKLVRIVIPNAFLPASTGADRYFRIIYQDNVIVDFDIIIYNRFGQAVFESDSKFFEWDGGDYGMDVFYYTLKAELIDGYQFLRNGNLTLIR